jgi:hypothetical protein
VHFLILLLTRLVSLSGVLILLLTRLQLTSRVLFSAAAHGSRDTSVAVHQTFGSFFAQRWTMASDSSFHCHHWERGNYLANLLHHFPTDAMAKSVSSKSVYKYGKSRMLVL